MSALGWLLACYAALAACWTAFVVLYMLLQGFPVTWRMAAHNAALWPVELWLMIRRIGEVPK